MEDTHVLKDKLLLTSYIKAENCETWGFSDDSLLQQVISDLQAEVAHWKLEHEKNCEVLRHIGDGTRNWTS